MLLALFTISGLTLACRYDVRIPFLQAQRTGQWIVFPSPASATAHRAAPNIARFRQAFTLQSKPRTASISILAFRNASVQLNGVVVDSLNVYQRHWKTARNAEVMAHLRAGQNELSVTVSNFQGPPALWLAFSSDSTSFSTDATWDVMLTGTDWQKAAAAFTPPSIRPGNYLFGGEAIVPSFRHAKLFVGALLGGGLAMLLLKFKAPPGFLRKFLAPGSMPGIIFGLVALSWLVLFGNNLRQLPALQGFDRDGHLEYIDYILRQKSLPLADQGWQMYHPPLYHSLAAGILAGAGLSTSEDRAILILRTFSTLIALFQVFMIFLCLRLFFPGRDGPQIIGIVLAGFLPANLYLAHQISNETLAALGSTTALYFCLRILNHKDAALPAHLGAGLGLGLGMLTKFSALAVIPTVFATLLWVHARRPRGNWRPMVLQMGVLGLVMFAICGWHYVRVWKHFGQPFVGNWDAGLPFAWWQEPGFRSRSWYCGFGETLARPLFSSFNSFLDGLYSSLWGDGLCGGAASLSFRPPWNYDLMNICLVLSLPLTGLILIGTISAFRRFFYRPTPDWFLVLSLISAFGIALLYMSLLVASFAQVKAFYAMAALFPFCALAGRGWDAMSGRFAPLKCLFTVAVSAWVITAYLTFWVRSADPARWLVNGTSLAAQQRWVEAIDCFSQAIKLEPGSVPARTALANALRSAGKPGEAQKQAEIAMSQNPASPEASLQLGFSRASAGLDEEALGFFRNTIRQAPDSPNAHEQLVNCLCRLHRYQEAVTACSEGLRVDPYNYFILNNFAWIRATGEDSLRNGAEAVAAAEGACALSSYSNAQIIGTLAAAYAEAGRFPEAVRTAQRACEVAKGQGQQELAAKNAQLMELYRTGQPCREN